MNVLLALTSGLFGALLVFVLGWLKDHCEKKRELEGLLRLVDKEILHNDHNGLPELAVQTAASSMNLQAYEFGRPLRTDTWHQVRVRIARLLLNSEKFNELATYYLDVQTLNNLLDPHASPIQRKIIEQIVGPLTKQGEDIMKWIESDYLRKYRST